MTGDRVKQDGAFDESRYYPIESFKSLTLLPERIDVLLASLVGGPLAFLVGIGIATSDWGKDQTAMQVFGIVLVVVGAGWTVAAITSWVRRGRTKSRHSSDR